MKREQFERTPPSAARARRHFNAIWVLLVLGLASVGLAYVLLTAEWVQNGEAVIYVFYPIGFLAWAVYLYQSVKRYRIERRRLSKSQKSES